MRKLAGSIAIFPPEASNRRISTKGLELQRDIRRHNSQMRKIQHICWDCTRLGGLYNTCKFTKDFSKCPKIRNWMNQNNIEEL